MWKGWRFYELSGDQFYIEDDEGEDDHTGGDRQIEE